MVTWLLLGLAALNTAMAATTYVVAMDAARRNTNRTLVIDKDGVLHEEKDIE